MVMRSTHHLKRNSVSFDPREMAAAAANFRGSGFANFSEHLSPIDALVLHRELKNNSIDAIKSSKSPEATIYINRQDCSSPNLQQTSITQSSQRRRNSYAADAFNTKERPLPTSPSASFVTYLRPPSPTSAYGRNKPSSCSRQSESHKQCESQRRRNSYAAASTILESHYGENEREMMTSGSSSRSEYFLDPNMAACRRRLPPTPNNKDTGISSSSLLLDINAPTSNTMPADCSPIIRRGSSPRVLPLTPMNGSNTTLTGVRSYGNVGLSNIGSLSPNSESKYTQILQTHRDNKWTTSPKLNPPQIRTDNYSNFDKCSSDKSASSGILERRPSTGRRLPLPPMIEHAQDCEPNKSNVVQRQNLVVNSTTNSTGRMSSSFCGHAFSDSIDEPNFLSSNNNLQRSASSRQYSNSNKSSAQLPPMPNEHTIPTTRIGSTSRLMRTTSSTESTSYINSDFMAEKSDQIIRSHNHHASNFQVEMILPPTIVSPRLRTSSPPAVELHSAAGKATSASLSADGSVTTRRMPTPDIGAMLQAPIIAKSSTLQKPSASAPQSPRSGSLTNSCNSTSGSSRSNQSQTFAQSTQTQSSNSTTIAQIESTPSTSTTKSPSSGSVSSTTIFVPVRKHSDAFETSIARNGSMAFLLEQQHILRREFCNNVSSADNTQSISGNVHATSSNSSSLSPSIEQLNCGGSKSGSDAEEAVSASGVATGGGTSPSCDARMHGIDPSLYMAGATSAAVRGMSTSTSMQSATSSSYSFQNETAQNAGNASSPLSTTASTSGGVTWSTAQQTSTITPASTGISLEATDVPRPSGLGLIHCTLQHFPVRKRLRVSVLKIEGLAGELKPELEILPFVKVNLLPGKQKQSGVVKRGRDAVFNQEFFFDGVATEELESKTLSIEVCHQSSQKLQKDTAIGEIFVPLKDLTQLQSKKEIRIVEELKYSINSKKLGKIYLTTCIEKEARRLTINIIKVDDLPKWGIIGAPDVCVRITLAQGTAAPQTKSSRVLKSTTSAVYKEAVMFLISTKKSDLQHTRVTISVHDLSRSTTGNDVIGSVYLGELAVDKSEMEQWRQTVEHWGKEYKGSHHLKLSRQNAPDVHVSETQSDTEDAE